MRRRASDVASHDTERRWDFVAELVDAVRQKGFPARPRGMEELVASERPTVAYGCWAGRVVES